MKTAIVAMLGLFSAISHAMDGNQLLNLLKSPDSVYVGANYIAGVVDTINTANEISVSISGNNTPSKPCIPKGATYGQATDIARAYLENNPANRHKLASGQVWRALVEAYPCK